MQGFAAINREWLTRVLARHEPEQQVLADWAQAIFAAVTGAQLAARGEGDIQVFDATIAVYRQRGLIPA